MTTKKKKDAPYLRDRYLSGKEKIYGEQQSFGSIEKDLSQFTVQKKQTERDYWIECIWEEVKKTMPQCSFEKVFWRINNNVKPCHIEAVKALYFRLLHEKKDPQSPYSSFAHSFFARTKVNKKSPDTQ